MSSILVWSLRNSWCEPDPLERISTPRREREMCVDWGVQSSSQDSQPRVAESEHWRWWRPKGALRWWYSVKKRLPRQQNGLHPTALRRRPVSGEIPPLPVIPIVRQRALGPHQQHPPILANDPAIVPHPPVQHRHAEIAHQIVRRPAREQLGQRLPAVPKGVHFQKVVFAAVAADLQLRPQAVRGAARLGHLARAEDALEVPLEVEGPLVQVAGGEGHEGGGGEGEAQGRGGLGGDGGAGEGVRVGNGGGGGGSAGGEQREGGSAADAAAEAASRRPGGARCRCAWHGVHF
mmetsp:Transcript_20539/g.42892  ORF Transcript_20539/g.42892 Transcript_20539/m.42892 type:complete len:291 (-) Transcript_20539:16-888(-)